MKKKMKIILNKVIFTQQAKENCRIFAENFNIVLIKNSKKMKRLIEGKKIVLVICGAAIIAMAAINVNFALNSGKPANLSLVSLFSLANGENGNSGYARVGLEDLGICIDCQSGKEYRCGQVQVFCEGSGSLTPNAPCGSIMWGDCVPTGKSCN